MYALEYPEMAAVPGGRSRYTENVMSNRFFPLLFVWVQTDSIVTDTVSNETWTEVSVIRTRSDTWRIKFKNAACLITRRVMKCHIPGTLIHGVSQNISILTPCTRSISKWHELCTLWCGVSGVLYFLHFDTQSVTILIKSWHLLLGISGSITNCVSTCDSCQ